MKNASPAITGRPTSQAGRRRPGRSSVVAAAVIAWLGLLVHNVADLPDQTLLSPETLWPSLVTAVLLAIVRDRSGAPGRDRPVRLGPAEPGRRHIERPTPCRCCPSSRSRPCATTRSTCCTPQPRSHYSWCHTSSSSARAPDHRATPPSARSRANQPVPHGGSPIPRPAQQDHLSRTFPSQDGCRRADVGVASLRRDSSPTVDCVRCSPRRGPGRLERVQVRAAW